MPITFLFSCMVFLALILLGRGRKGAALMLLGVPVGMIGLSVCLTASIFAMMWLYGVRRSSNPAFLFEDTFGFKPPPQTDVCDGYSELGMDWEKTVLKFRAPREVIGRITAGRFFPTDKEAFASKYESEGRDLPRRVQVWFLPLDQEAGRFYIAEPFDRSIATRNEAILCYNEKTGVACFHWTGLD